MKTRADKVAVYVLMFMLVLSGIGCARIFGPSEEEAIQAITNTGMFSGGVEKFSLKSPIKLIERKSRKDGSWPIVFKMTVAYTMIGGKESKPMEKTSVFYFYKSKDSAGKTIWMAK